MFALHKLALFVCLAFLSSCTFIGCTVLGGTTPFRSELANQGPIGLSESNPYISGNLLLAKEMEASPVFKGFVENKGTPDAIEIRKIFFSADQIFLYYLSDNEYYSFLESPSNWLIKGPFKINSVMLDSLANLTMLKGPAPLVNIEKSGKFSETDTLASADELPELKRVKPAVAAGNPKIITPTPRASLKKEIKPEKVFKDKAAWAKDTNGVSQAEESISGDVIHKVSFEGEDLKTLAKWYTGDINNTGRIARINGIDADSTLNHNQTIRIPRYLIKNTNPLPETEIKKKKDSK